MVVTQNLVTSVLEMGILGGVGQKAGDCFEVRDERKPSRSMAADTTRLHLPELGARRRAGWAGLNLGEMRQTGGLVLQTGRAVWPRRGSSSRMMAPRRSPNKTFNPRHVGILHQSRSTLCMYSHGYKDFVPNSSKILSRRPPYKTPKMISRRQLHWRPLLAYVDGPFPPSVTGSCDSAVPQKHSGLPRLRCLVDAAPSRLWGNGTRLTPRSCA
jgi:hypothetical protein